MYRTLDCTIMEMDGVRQSGFLSWDDVKDFFCRKTMHRFWT